MDMVEVCTEEQIDFVAVFKFMLTSRRWHLFVLLAHHPEEVLRLMGRNFQRWVALS